METTKFDAADYLETPEAVAAFLDEAAKADDPAHFAHALGIVARSKGMSKIAKDMGVSRETLYRSLSEDDNPHLSTLFGVMRALGLPRKMISPPKLGETS
ncbi:MAG: transcriptional [Beijerinckiaceae bacterium]|nr:MAG: transcriptional [Beijerinckiaceae bacterium]